MSNLSEQALPRPLQEALYRHKVFAKALFERPESLSSFLPYEEYLPECGIFRQKDGSIGAIYDVKLCEHETKTSEQITALLEGLKSWFRLDESLTLSLHFEQSPISAHDRVWDGFASKKDTERADIPGALHLNQLTQMKSSGSFFQRRLYLSVRSFEKPTNTTSKIKRLSAELANPHATLSNQMVDFVRRAREFNQALSQFEMTSPLPLKKLCAHDLVDVLRRIFNPKTYYERPFAPVNDNVSLSNQIIYCPSKIDYAGIAREGTKTRTITLKNAPSLAYPGAMAYFLSLTYPFRISLNISFPKVAAVKRHFAVKEFFLQNTPSAKSRRQKAEIEALQESLIRDNRVLNMTFSILLEGENDQELDLRTRECLARFQQKLECEAIVEREIGFGMWLNALPLNYHPIADYTSKRAIRILSSDIVHFCPIFGSFQGTTQAQSVFSSREGTLVPFALKSFGNSHMTAVLGDTGSAKSGQVIKILLGELRKDPKPLIFVIDHKTSYGMLSKYLPSELTTFEMGKPMPFSPFSVSGTLDEDKVRFLVQLLTAAMQLTSPQFEIDSEHRTCLEQAIRLAYESKMRAAGVKYEKGRLVDSDEATTPLVTMDDIISQLGSLTGLTEFDKYGSFVDDITKKLRPFYSDGMYAPFFKRTSVSHSTQSADLYVYDMDGLGSDPILQTLVTMSVVDEIRRKIRSDEAKQRGGFVVIEELGMLGRNNPVAKDFVIDAAETFRKLGFFLIGLTPNPRNYFDTAAGQAMWAVADHYLFLTMKDDNVDFLAKNSNLLDEASIQIVKSLRTVRGQFAECFYVHKNRELSGAFRSTPSAHEMWLMPTHRPDALEAQKTLDHFPSDPLAALEDLVSRYPKGTTDSVQEPGK